MRLRSLLAALALTALAPVAVLAPGGAQADTPSYYLGISGGANMSNNSDVSGAANADLDFDIGPTGSVYFGHRYSGTGFRTEIEFGYRTNDVDSISDVAGTGDVSTINGMLNLLYDFDAGGRLSPYVGGGLGAANVDFDGVGPLGGFTVSDDQTVFAFQVIGGLSYGLSESIELFGDYKYFATEDVDVTLGNGFDAEAEYENHVISIGLRWSFGGSKPKIEARPVKKTPPPPPPPEPEPEPEPAPPPPPEPEPAPEPQAVLPQVFIVFFDWNRAVLTSEAGSIVRAAADYSERAVVTRLEVTGHADRSGPASYNQRLSMRRAETVLAELVRLGVPESAIAVFAKGEKEPLVPTDDGVREPQNRRVEIILE